MKKAVLLSAAAACMGAAGPVLAQERDHETVERRNSEIVVTGRRAGLDAEAAGGALGDRSILDTPFSVTVIDEQDLELRQPGSIGQVFVNDPSVFSFATPGTVNWWGLQIRGLGVRNYYVDDTPLLLYWGGDYPLEAVESVQALKGSTGFMYGFGAPGGTISYRTKRPTDEPMLMTEAGFRGRSVFSGHLDAGGPAGDDFGYRVNLAVEEGEEYNGAEIRRGLAALALDYEITPDLIWRFNVAFEDYDLGAEPFQVYWSSYSDSALPSVPDDWDNLNVDNSYYRYALWTGATSLDWEFSENWSARAVLGLTRKRHRSNKTFVYMLNDEGDYEGYLYQFSELDTAQFAQLMLQGDVTTGPIRHELVMGVSQQVMLSDFGAASVWSNEFNGNVHEDQPYGIPPGTDFSTNGWPFDERQTGVFVSDTMYFGEHWQAIVGLRRSYYDLEDLDGEPSVASGYTTTALTPTVALLYKPVENATAYVSYVESLESGGRVGNVMYENFGELLDATISKQYEAGFKYEAQNLSLTAALFRIERVETMEDDRSGLLYLTQDGLAVYEGVELMSQFDVGEDLTLGLGIVHLDATIEDTDNAAIRGNRPAEVAEWQIVGNVSYDVPAVRGLSLHGNVRYYGEAPTDSDNQLYIPDYTLVNVGFGYAFSIAGRDARLSGNLNNALNEQYWGLGNFGETINGSISLAVDW